jgi:non-ribosomal peptide synthetase component F
MNAVEYCLLHGLKLAGSEHPAILCAQESLSYGALAARVSQFAAGLREAGVRPNDRVGMLMLDTPDLIALHLGAVGFWPHFERCSQRSPPRTPWPRQGASGTCHSAPRAAELAR